MAPSHNNKSRQLQPLTSHLIVFLGGIVLGVLIQPYFVPDQTPQFFVPDLGAPASHYPTCPKCPVAEPLDCPVCPACECETCKVCEECEDCEECSCSEAVAVAESGDPSSCPSWFHRVTQDYLPAGADKHFKGAMGKGWWFLGCKSDVDEVLDILKLFYQGPDKDGVFVDIGANLGQVTENLVQTFGNIPWNRYKRKYGLEGLYCKNDPHPGAEVYMFEPQPNNAKRIRERMDFSHWNLERIKLIEAAVSNYSGEASFSMDAGETYSETGSLGTVTANLVEQNHVTVEVLSFDDAYEQHLQGKKIFMMKTDTEGFDGTVVRGMKKVLANNKIRFLTFEYHHLWFDNDTGDTLKKTVELLGSFDYFCYFILPQRLLPISGKYWQDKFEMRRWSNVFCGKQDDFLLEKTVLMYHTATLVGREETNQFKTQDDAMSFFFTGEGN